MTILSELRASLQKLLTDPDNLIGGNILGTYTDQKKKVTPAIWVGNTPELFVVKGLECVLAIAPEVYSFRAAGNRNIHSCEEYTIYLVQHSAPNTLVEAMSRISRLFPEAEMSRQLYDDNLDILEQVVVTLKHYVQHKALGRVYYKP